jgi:hypothetical protein
VSVGGSTVDVDVAVACLNANGSYMRVAAGASGMNLAHALLARTTTPPRKNALDCIATKKMEVEETTRIQ